ncbi:MAG: XdhC family protein [Alkalispirochaetaceae bacterium]
MVYGEGVLRQAARWIAEGEEVVLATITRIDGSSSQPLASRMVISRRERFFGSVSGGCVEKDVALHAGELFLDRRARVLDYGRVEDSFLQVGLNCEGRIRVLLEPLDGALLGMLRRPAGTVLRTTHLLDPEEGEDARVAHELLEGEEAERREAVSRVYEDEGRSWVELIEPRQAPAVLLIFGASPVAYPLSSLASSLGYRVVLTDPRPAYLSAEQFPDADEVIPSWPRELPGILEQRGIRLDSRTAVVSLNHEPRFEDDLLRTLMQLPRVGYIGSMGKRARQEERVARQSEAGYDLSRLPEIHTPIGLDLGGRGPEDIALSILAEIQAWRYRREPRPLSAPEEGRPAFYGHKSG